MKPPTVKLPAKTLRPRMVRSTFGAPYIEGFTRPEKDTEETRADLHHALAALYEDRAKSVRTSTMERTMHQRNKRFLDAIFDAMNECEEIQGPAGDDYVEVMRAVATEAADRAERGRRDHFWAGVRYHFERAGWSHEYPDFLNRLFKSHDGRPCALTIGMDGPYDEAIAVLEEALK